MKVRTVVDPLPATALRRLVGPFKVAGAEPILRGILIAHAKAGGRIPRDLFHVLTMWDLLMLGLERDEA